LEYKFKFTRNSQFKSSKTNYKQRGRERKTEEKRRGRRRRKNKLEMQKSNRQIEF